MKEFGIRLEVPEEWTLETIVQLFMDTDLTDDFKLKWLKEAKVTLIEEL